jgi:glycerophosphoryl diester phosphodiesterase
MGEAFATGVVDRARELGIALNIWTVNDPGEIARLGAVGVDAVITDTPAVAREVLQRR